ncbi:MAG: rhomboid family intramembrane serine protease, partial [Pirellulales bacterium]
MVPDLAEAARKRKLAAAQAQAMLLAKRRPLYDNLVVMPVSALVKLAQRFPVIVSVELAAIIVTGWWWSGGNVELVTMDARAWHGEFWRPFSSALPHVDVIHLVFNLYWLAVFGSRVELVFGSLTTALWLLLFAGGSMMADYDLADGGVGLSGVGYGLFGFVWVLSERDFRFHDAMRPQIAQLFVGWFFLCVALTYMDVWHVANVAHGAGAAFGALAGLVMSPSEGYQRPAAAATLFATVIAVFSAGAFARPYVNFTGAAGGELDNLAIEALQRGDNQAAINLLERAVSLRGAAASWWHNLGVAYHREQRNRDAARAFRRAAQLSLD